MHKQYLKKTNNIIIEKGNTPTCAKYCTLLMFHYQNHNNHLIKCNHLWQGWQHGVFSCNFFTRLRNTFVGTLNHSSWHILSRSFRFLGLCLSTDLFNSAHRFSIGVWWLRRPLQNVDFVVTEPFLCGSWGMLWVLLESQPKAKSGRENQIFSQNWLILDGIHYAINPNQCPWTSGIKTAPKHDPPPYFTVGMRCFSLCASLFLT